MSGSGLVPCKLMVAPHFAVRTVVDVQRRKRKRRKNAARAKAMSEKGGAAAAVSALTAKAKLAGMWREKLDQHNTGSPVYERIERVIVERAPQSAAEGIPDESIYDRKVSTSCTMPYRHQCPPSHQSRRKRQNHQRLRYRA